MENAAVYLATFIANCRIGQKRKYLARKAGEMTRAVICGTPYPYVCCRNWLPGIRADGDKRTARMAMMKSRITAAF